MCFAENGMYFNTLRIILFIEIKILRCVLNMMIIIEFRQKIMMEKFAGKRNKTVKKNLDAVCKIMEFYTEYIDKLANSTMQ